MGLNRRRSLALTLALAAVALSGLSACGGDDGDGAGSESDYADGACVDRLEPAAPDLADPEVSAFPVVVDCDSPEAQGVLREVEDFEQDCPAGQGFEFGEVAVEDEDASTQAYCIEPL